MPDFHVLFVCIGNVCRSPLGERLLRARLPAAGFSVASAGVNGLEGSVMDPGAVLELEALGGSADGFVARRLDDAMIQASDLVLTATSEIRSRVLAEAPGALRRTFTVREFAALLDEVHGEVGGADLSALVAAAAAARSRANLDDYDIPDPYRRGQEQHAASAAMMAAAVETVAKGLQR